MSKKRIVCLALGVIAAIAFFLIPPPAGLTAEAMQGIGILLCGIIWMVGAVFPDFAVMIAMLAAWVVLKILPFATAFSAFSGTSFWLLLGAMVIGVAGSKSGLLMRIALAVLRVFPANFQGQVLALLTSGLIISPLVPSTAAKAAIMGPIAKQISDTMGYENQSRGSAGLFYAYFTGFTCFGPIFLSGSFIAYSMLGAMPEGFEGVTWIQWAYYALPWSIVMIVLSYIAIVLLFKPKGGAQFDKATIADMSKALGPIKRDEWITLAVMGGCLVLWMLERTIDVSSAAVAVLAMTILVASKVLDKADFDKKVNWNLVFFIGAVISIGSMIKYLGIDVFIGDTLTPLMAPLVSRPIVFVLGFVAVVLLARFVIASTLTSTVLFTVALVPFGLSVGISPWVIGFIAYVSVHVWFLRYQMPLYLTANATAGNGEMLSQRQAALQSTSYIVISTIGLLVSLPWWKFLGLMP